MKAWCEAIIYGGFLGLLIYLPIPQGGVFQRPVTFLACMSGVLLLLRIVSLVFVDESEHFFLPFSWAIPAMLFALLPLLQLIPVPGALFHRLSPVAYQFYEEAALTTTATLSASLPVSIYAQATEQEAIKFLAYAMLLFVLLTTLRSQKHIDRIVRVLLVLGTAEALYGLSPYLLSHTQQSLFMVRGTFEYKNHFAGYLEMIIVLGCGALASRSGVSSSSSSKISNRRLLHGIDSILLGVMLLAHLLSGSRWGLVSLTGGITVFLVLAGGRKLLRLRMILVLILMPLALIAAMLIGQEFLLTRIASIADAATDASFYIRWEWWRSAWAMFRDFPLFGSGAGTFVYLLERYQTFRYPIINICPENEYLHLLQETGIVGALLAVWIVVGYAASTIRAWLCRRSRWSIAMTAGGIGALASQLIRSGMDFHIHTPATALLFITLAAITYRAAHLSRNPKPSLFFFREERRKRSRLNAIFAGILTICYLAHVIISFRAFLHYERVHPMYRDETTLATAAQKPQFRQHLESAIHGDPNNAVYAAALGHALLRNKTGAEADAAFVNEAEGWLQRASLLNPTNADYYVALAYLSDLRGDCAMTTDGLEECATARYLQAALRNAPKRQSIRKMVVTWYYQHAPEAAAQIVEQMQAQDTGNIHQNWQVARQYQEFSELLYTLDLDFAADREAAHAIAAPEPQACPPQIVRHAPDERELELGSDDGAPDWAATLSEPGHRLKKVICLPPDVDAYTSAAVKIFMYHGGEDRFTLRIGIDDQTIQVAGHTVSPEWRWQEIWFDPSVLRGKTRVNIYLRVENASAPRNVLRVPGDADASTQYSSFGDGNSADLSPDAGRQSGEYMIRLVLRK